MVLLKFIIVFIKKLCYIDLHSTMVLLKLLGEADKETEELNLHSTMVLLKSDVLVLMQSLIITSTFHYGSIKIER